MSDISTIQKNSLWLFLGKLFLLLIGIFLNAWIARYLNPEFYGFYSLALNFVAFFSVFASLGLDVLMIRELSKNWTLSSKYLSIIIRLKILLSFFSILLAIILVFLLPYSHSLKLAISIFSLSILFTSLDTTFITVFLIKSINRITVIGDVISKSFYAVLVILFISIGGGYLWLIVASLFALLVKLIYDFWYFTKYVHLNLNYFDKKDLIYIIKKSFPLFIISILSLIYFRIDIIMLSFLADINSVGFYSASFKLSEFFHLIPGILFSAMLPFLVTYSEKNKSRLIKSINLSLKYLSILSFPIVIGTVILSSEIINLIYGSSYTTSSISLSLLISTIIFVFFNYSFANGLFVLNNEKYITKVALSAVLFNIITNFIFIPLYSYNGAALTTLFTEILIFLFYFRKLSKSFKLSFIFLPKLIFCTILMGILTLFLDRLNLFFVFNIIFSAVFYMVFIFVLKIIDKEDMSRFFYIFKR
ncbi:flippase [Candidatus Woesearchaeota archaeon]|nr:flippase [Candidatus Woesearchaeota archaeon]